MDKQLKRILVVDDEEGLRESFKLVLGDFYSLIFAVNGIEALEKIKADPPNLVLLDIKMPRLNGLDLLKQIHKSHPNLPVIIVTGYQSVETAQDALKNGAADYIPKPFDSKQLQDSVKTHIR